MAEEAGHSEPTDYELLRRAADGERQAFELVYQRYQQVVYRFAQAMTGRPDAAEDVTQEVFIALIKELPRYDPARAGFTTYLYGIARNLSRDRWRRARKRLALEATGLVRHSTNDDPFELIERAQTATQVHRALRGLPLRYEPAATFVAPQPSPELKVFRTLARQVAYASAHSPHHSWPGCPGHQR
jgi:RNA polymerase sigma-70 factor, ECF subfamily